MSPSPICRIALAFLISSVATLSAAERLTWEQLKPVKQTGPSCAFFANVPALALATGYDISSSKTFTSSVYGLRRGDFKFERSFDKRIFCELFALPWEIATVQHPDKPRKELLAHAEEVIRNNLDPGLEKGWVYSLRVNGIHGGPHNVLLMAKAKDKYVVHNPGPGKMKHLSIEQLADKLLVRSTLEENRIKPVYITHYMSIALDRQKGEQALPLSSLPRELSVELSPEQTDQLKSKLARAVEGDAPKKMADWMKSYPEIDFAAMQRTDENAPRNVIGSKLAADELKGIVHLSQFHLALWHSKRRAKLPVVFMDHEPWIMTAYQNSDDANARSIAFFNGVDQRWLSKAEALKLIHGSGALVGTVEIEANQ